MPSFSYKCVRAGSQIVKGVGEAKDAKALARALEAEGLTPLAISELKGAARGWLEAELSPALRN
jgi:type II secretory pathway component PulF